MSPQSQKAYVVPKDQKQARNEFIAQIVEQLDNKEGKSFGSSP